jgi:plastocyanin
MRLGPLVVALLAVLALAACGSSGDEGGGDGGAPAAGGEALEISETEYSLDPSSLEVDSTGEVTIRVTNDGSIAHALEVENEDAGIEEETEEIQPGESAELTVNLSADGSYELYCPIGDHRERGMEGTLAVGGGGAAPTTTGDEDETTTEDDDGAFDY